MVTFLEYSNARTLKVLFISLGHIPDMLNFLTSPVLLQHGQRISHNYGG